MTPGKKKKRKTKKKKELLPFNILGSREPTMNMNYRIRGSRIGAWASRQSTVLQGREELEARVEEVKRKFEGQEKIPIPPFWGGMRIVPTAVEFWVCWFLLSLPSLLNSCQHSFQDVGGSPPYLFACMKYYASFCEELRAKPFFSA